MNDTPESPSIHVLMPRVMSDIGAVEKTDSNVHFNYKFRGIDAVYNALNPALTRHGVFYVPQLVSHKLELTPSGKQWHAEVLVRYRFYGPNGDYVEAEGMGEALDSQDKALPKAQQAAVKYALLTTFCIPTKDQRDDDPDAQPAHDWAETSVAGDDAPSASTAAPPPLKRPDRPQDEQLSGTGLMAPRPAGPSTDDPVKQELLSLLDSRLAKGDLTWERVRGKAIVAAARVGDTPPTSQSGLKNLSAEALRLVIAGVGSS